MRDILEYIDVGGLHTLVVGGSDILMSGIVQYTDVAGLHTLFIGG